MKGTPSGGALAHLLLRARDGREQATRWSSIAVVALLIFDLTAVVPYVRQSQSRETARRDAEQLGSATEVLRELSRQTREIGVEIRSSAEPLLRLLVDDLGHDLRRIEATRRYARKLLAEVGEGAEADQDVGAGNEEEDDRSAEPFQIDNPDWIVALGEARGRDELLAAYEPVVEDRVVRPRFQAFDQAWTDRVLPAVEARIDTVAARIPALRGRFPQADPAWESFAAALAGLRRAARDFELEPPEAPFWWASSEEGDAGGPELVVEPAMAEQLLQPLALDAVQTAADQASKRARELVEDHVDRQRSLESAFGEQENGEALSFAGGNLRTVAATFPLLLGLILATLRVWRARRIRELGLLVHLSIADGESPRLRSWLLSQVGNARSEWAALRGLGGGLVVTTLLELAWIGGNTYQQLRGGPLIELRLLAWLAGLGGAVVVAATLYAAVVNGAVVRLLAPRSDSAASGRAAHPAGSLPPAAPIDDGTLDASLLDDNLLDDGKLDDGLLDDGKLDDGLLDDGLLDDGLFDDSLLDEEPLDGHTLKR